MAQNDKCPCGSGRKFRYCCGKKLKNSNELSINILENGPVKMVFTRNLLSNFVRRDIIPVQKSFDENYWDQMSETDKLFSDAAFVMWLGFRDHNTEDKYQEVLPGLVSNSLDSFGNAVSLLRSGYPKQAMMLLRHVIELSSTIIHIVSDPKQEAIDTFLQGKYKSSKAVTQADKALPILGEFWGFLSNTFVHINRLNSVPHKLKPFKKNDETVDEIINAMKMTCWIAYLSTELAYPGVLPENRYWKIKNIGDRHGVSFDPTDKEREWAKEYLGHSIDDDDSDRDP